MLYDAVIIGASIIDIPAGPVDASVFQSGSHPVDRLAFQVGGDAINEATILSHLGHRIKLISKIGDDLGGRFIQEHCDRLHINRESFIIDSSMDTGINIVLIEPDGERSFITSNRGGLRQLRPEDIDVSTFSQSSLLCFASIFVFPFFSPDDYSRIFAQAKKNNMTLCADMTKCKNQETVEDLKEALSYLDFVFPNLEEARMVTRREDPDDVADAFLDCGVKHAVIKLGKQGCLIKSRQERLLIPALPNIHCLDTTGAGDNFAAGFLSGLIKKQPLRECGRIANETAAKCIEKIGATAWINSDG
ncbi:MAG: carbohydrate kinase family protein [Ruminococcus sp.]|jgi:sugar/nucleoside kinase (ribokinase family)